MTAETDLLPCPWCGEKLASVSVGEGSTFRWRKVDGCCADGPEVRHNTMADDQEAAEVESRTAAIAAWNARANLAELQREVEGLRAEVALLTHKVITCGVAADHPNPNLTRTGAYASKWDSPQAERVRVLRDRAERLAEALRRMVGASYVVCTTIDPRGHRWCEAYLDEALPEARAALDQETTNG